MVDETQNKAYKGELIREAIDGTDFTLQKVAKQSGVSRPTIYQIIKGDNRVAVKKIAAVANVLQVPLEKIFEKEQPA